MKAADASVIPKGSRSVSIIRSPEELLAFYRQMPIPYRSNFVLQEFIPTRDAEDWVVHAYANPPVVLLGDAGPVGRVRPW